MLSVAERESVGGLPLSLFRWLDRHPGSILLAGLAASLAANALAFRRDRRAVRRLKEKPARCELEASPPLVSFLVPAWNEAPNVEGCIRSILSLRYPNKELVLCAGGRDGTLERCARYAGDGVLVLEQEPGEGKQGALRRCFRHSRGEILFLTDADCLVDDDCVEATLEPLLVDGACAVTGYWQPFQSLTDRPFVAYQWANHLRYQAAMPHWAQTLDGRNSAVRRQALVAAGAFQNEAATGTDYVLSQRLRCAGYRIRAVLASRVQTDYPAGIRAYLQQGSRWYRNRLVQGLRYRQWRDVALSLWSAGASLFLLAGPLALLVRWRAAGCAWLAGLFHLGLSTARLAWFWQRVGLGRKASFANLWRFAAYTLVSDWSMVRGLLAAAGGRGRNAW
jgi:cellulose synthase/poly-beta-1,6-N-acetylglucosamine synthase-like glycosyltransferase